MNNRQNGRRRGRGGQQVRGGQPGNQDRGNRIDNRARGNAAQLLEKYKSLARDSQMQGDRVNTEYYLQFADHYFRVLSETRSRFEEQRPRQQGDYRPEFGDDMDMDGDSDGMEPGNGQDPRGWSPQDEVPREQPERRPREERVRDDRPREERPRVAETAPEPRPEGGRRRRSGRDAANGDGLQEGVRASEGEPVSDRIEVDRVPQGFALPREAAETVSVEGETGGDPVQAEAPPRRRRAPRRPRDEVAVDA